MDKDKVIIDYYRHQQLLDREQLWLKYRDKHMYSGLIIARVRSVFNGYETIGININREFTPNTPEEVKEQAEVQIEKLEAKIEDFHEESRQKMEELRKEMRERYGNIPKWIVKLFM